MEAKNSYCKPNEIDYIVKVIERDLQFANGMCLAQVVTTEAKRRPNETRKVFMVDIYLHKIRGLMIAKTKLINEEDTYAVVAAERSFVAFNVGADPLEGWKIIDKSHYDTLDKHGKECYLHNVCFSHIGLPSGTVIQVHDHHRKVKLDTLEVA